MMVTIQKPRTEGKAGPAPEGLMTVNLGVDLKAAWARYCAGLEPQERPGPALRKLVDSTLASFVEASGAGPGPSAAPSPVLAPFLGGAPDEGRRTKVQLSLTPSEGRAASAVARQMGYGLQEWIVAAIRAALARSPSFGQSELEALTASNVLLGQLVTNLASSDGRDRVGINELDAQQLRLELREHIRMVSELMAQGVRRWEIKV